MSRPKRENDAAFDRAFKESISSGDIQDNGDGTFSLSPLTKAGMQAQMELAGITEDMVKSCKTINEFIALLDMHGVSFGDTP